MDMNSDNRKRLTKVVISEFFMILSVIALVVILILIVSGYWINQDFEVERLGLLQVSSIPTGASINIDGDDFGIFQKTNTSKIVSSGEHEIILTRDGYDNWRKKVSVEEGLLYRLHYPRLFLNERTAEETAKFDNILKTFASPDHENLLMINNTSEWTLVELNNNEIKKKQIDVSGILTNKSTNIVKMTWSNNGDKILINALVNKKSNWLLLNLKDIKKSENLTELFGLNFENIKIFDDSADNLLVVESGNLRKINVPSRSISKILVKNIEVFNYLGGDIVFVASDNKNRYVGSLKNEKDIKIMDLNDEKVYVSLCKFYDEEYLNVVKDNEVTLYKGTLPVSMDDIDTFDEILSQKLSFIPEKITAGHNGEFYVFENGKKFVTLDMESMNFLDFEVESLNYGWIDNDMIYVIDDGKIIVYDYDGWNRREIVSKNVNNKYSVLITGDRWLYYFSDNSLMRENLLPR